MRIRQKECMICGSTWTQYDYPRYLNEPRLQKMLYEGIRKRHRHMLGIFVSMLNLRQTMERGGRDMKHDCSKYEIIWDTDYYNDKGPRIIKRCRICGRKWAEKALLWRLNTTV